MAVLNTKIDDELKERLEERAKVERRTIRVIVEGALTEYFERCDFEYGGELPVEEAQK